MAKSLTSNVTAGRLAGNSLPIFLVLLTDGVNTFRWATKDTDNFSAWTGTKHSADIFPLNKIPNIKHQINLPSKKHVADLSDMTMNIVNAAYTPTERFDQYLESSSIILEGMTLEIRLVFDDTNASWSNAIPVYFGDITKKKFTLGIFTMSINGRTIDRYPNIPPAQVEDSDYPDWNDSGNGNQNQVGKSVPMVLGQNLNDIPVMLTDSSLGAQIVTLDTETLEDFGTLMVDTNGSIWEVHADRFTVGASRDKATFSADTYASDLGLCPWITDLLSPDTWPSTNATLDPIGNSANAVDEDDSTTTSAITMANTYDTTIYRGFDTVISAALQKVLSGLSLLAVYGRAKITAASNLNAGATYLDHIRLPKTATSLALDTGRAEWPYASGTAYNSYSGSDSAVRYVIQSDANTAGGGTPSLDSVINYGVWFASGDRVLAAASFRFYEFGFHMEFADPFSTTQLYCRDPKGREYGSSAGFIAGTRYSSAATTDLMESPAAFVEAILRHEMGETTDIDTTSFDTAYTALNDWAYTGAGSDVIQEWSSGGVLTKDTNAQTGIAQICKESGLAFLDRYDGTYGISMIELTTAVKTIAHANDKIRSNGLREITDDHKKNIRNKFVIRWDWDERTGTYRETLRMNKDVSIISGSDFRYMENACQNSFDDYGVEQELKVDCKWIKEIDAAYKYLDWLIWRYTRLPRFIVLDSAGLDDVDLELMDTITVKHPLTDETTGIDFLVYSIVFNTNRLNTQLRGMNLPDLDRDNGLPA